MAEKICWASDLVASCQPLLESGAFLMNCARVYRVGVLYVSTTTTNLPAYIPLHIIPVAEELWLPSPLFQYISNCFEIGELIRLKSIPISCGETRVLLCLS